MSTTISIHATVHVGELSQEIAYLRNRNLILAQALYESEIERERPAEEVERISKHANICEADAGGDGVEWQGGDV
ncbi:hypothetical protein [Pararhizobium antarcticum]|uniref:Uncharacterized protein n=1 Tax=Pararhizobium antarcticum TaxID=1798805 RepID=A0A657LUJ8_9HYPH|nr:hypothetical protein [Pararhizobium antarcticum]OJF97564.1 hypothetical protein AX760_16505 [Pararhizobium antarcticum]